MSEDKPEFGNPKDIAWAKAPKKVREGILNSPDGYRRFNVDVDTELSQEDFEALFGELEPVSDNTSKEISLKKEKETYPQFTLPKGTVLYSGWYGNSESEEVGNIDAEKGVVVDVLGVRRPEKGKGPAPSWKVQETRVSKDGELIKTVYYVGRRGLLFIGESPR